MALSTPPTPIIISAFLPTCLPNLSVITRLHRETRPFRPPTSAQNQEARRSPSKVFGPGLCGSHFTPFGLTAGRVTEKGGTRDADEHSGMCSCDWHGSLAKMEEEYYYYQRSSYRPGSRAHGMMGNVVPDMPRMGPYENDRSRNAMRNEGATVLNSSLAGDLIACAN